MKYTLIAILLFAACDPRPKYYSEMEIVPVEKLNRFRITTYIWQREPNVNILLSKQDAGEDGREGVTSFELDSLVKVHKQWAKQEVQHFYQLDSIATTP